MAKVAKRERIIPALDVGTLPEAASLVSFLSGAAGMFKVGHRLFTAAGVQGLEHLVKDRGARVFLDLKYHDIPNTVAEAVAEATRLGVAMVNVHAAGGGKMMGAAAEAARRVAEEAGRARPAVVAVTVLTSMDDADLFQVGVRGSVEEQVRRLASLAQRAGLDGVVASPREIELIRAECGPDFLIVTPGIRLEGEGEPAPAAPEALRGKAGRPVSPADDQKRTLTPAEALARGADYLVIGRPLLRAANPRKLAEEILEGLPD